MEKIPGIQLHTVWRGMGIEHRLAIVKAIARYQATWSSFSFSHYGSLYYSEDLRELKQSFSVKGHGATVIDPKFMIGPSTARVFNDDGRSTVEFDRGPCKAFGEHSCL